MAKNNKVIKEQKKYLELQERYEEVNNYLLDLIAEHEQTQKELRYLRDFVRYQKLDKEFEYFKEHAHEDENSELPFPYLVL